MRISKEYAERRDEILDVASKLFSMKGYQKSTVNDILNEVGIAKGTFYYYFKSKEEVLDAIIERVAELVATRVEEVASNLKLTPMLKLMNTMLAMRVENQMDNNLLEELHKPENALMHQKSLNSVVEKISPILYRIVQEGMEQGVFHSDFPEQYIQIFLTSSITLLDEGIFPGDPKKQQMIFRALVALLEKMLGVADGIFWDMAKEYWS
jgi:Transcriptional regulator